MKDTYYLVSVLFRSTYCNDPSVPVIVILLILSEWSYTHPDFSDSKDSVILILLILSLWSWSYPAWMILLILLLWSYWTCVSNSTEGLPLWSWLCDLACLSKWSYWSRVSDPTEPVILILLFLVDWSYWSSIYISFMTTQDLYRDHYLSACSGFLCSVKCVGNCLLLQQQDNQWIDLRTLSHLYVQFLDILHNRHDRFKTTMKTVDWAVIFI